MASTETIFSKDSLSRFLEQLKKELGMDFTEYSQASVRRRLERILKKYNSEDLDELFYRLSKEPLLRSDFLERFTVNVTEMFRDPQFFKEIWKHLGQAIEDRETHRYHIWHPACSSGEEILSLAILLHKSNHLQPVQFRGTDINEKMLERGTRRLVKRRLLSDYGKNYEHITEESNFEEFFHPINDDESRLSDDIRLKVNYEIENLMQPKQPLEERYDAIICRNVMIYFNPSLQQKVFSLLIQQLKKGGILALGNKESVVFCKELNQLEPIDDELRIYRKAR